MSQIFEAYEMQPSTLPSNTESDEDQSLKCWEEVKAETGFSSYKSFLEALKEKGLEFGGLLGNLNRYGHRDYWARAAKDSGTIFVIDILNDGSTSISLEMQLRYGGHKRGRSFDGSMLDSDRKSITPLLQNLRSPPQHVPARIVFWSMPRSAELYPGIVDVLGLGLKLQPSFFEALLAITQSRYSSLRPNGLDFVQIGENVATVARNYRPERRTPPIVIITGSHDFGFDGWTGVDKLDKRSHVMVEQLLNEEVLISEIEETASIYRWATNKYPPDYKVFTARDFYYKLFSTYVQKNCSSDLEYDTPLLIAMVPLLHLQILRLRVQCEVVRSAFLEVQYGVASPHLYLDNEKQESYQVLDRQRFWLRRRLEALEEGRDCSVKFIRSQDAVQWLESKTWLSEDENIREALAEARTVDAKVRDYMQLQIGNLSILESRKSIQLSNQQFDEAKKSKKCDSSSVKDILLINPKPKYVGNP